MMVAPKQAVLGLACMLISCTLMLQGCIDGNQQTGNGSPNQSSTTSENPTTSVAPSQGILLHSTLLNHTSLDELHQAVQTPQSKVVNIFPLYSVNSYRLTYLTIDGDGTLTEASGLISIPQKTANTSSPLLSFQHGTIFYNKDAPSNDLSASNPARLLASLGYVVISADYVGYGASQGKKHPYLRATPSAAAVTDFLSAARQWLATQSITINNQLFLTGYSEGGYVTLAAQRALETAGIHVTSSIAGAGPYHLQKTLDKVLSSSAISDALKQKLGFRPTANNVQREAAKYPGKWDELVVDTIMDVLIPDDSDIRFDKTFLMDYMADDYTTMEANSVYNWQARAPIRLTHGRDDSTVPFDNASITLDTMRQRQVDVALEECFATPADHDQCIRPYTTFVTNYLNGIAQNL